MKIGILTHPLDYNYGCLLQNFALQTTLTRMGHETITINRFTAPPNTLKLLKSWLMRLYLNVVRKQKESLLWNPYLDMKTVDVLSSRTRLFVDRNIKTTERIYPSDLIRIDKKYMFDAYVVGSDQVWLPHFSLNAFLDFVDRDNVKRIFYAASSGKMTFADSPRISKRCKELSSLFSGISVREDSLIPIVNKVLNRNALQVLDPTLLLDAKDYLDACVEYVESSPVVFTYILDKTKEKNEIVERIEQDLHLPIVRGTVELDYKKGKSMNINDCIYPSVDSWLLNISRSKFVVTDSFHGTCMAVTFRKPFVVIGNVERGIDRIKSLLRLLDLEERLIYKPADLGSAIYDYIDYDAITEKLSVLRKKSLSFLEENLKNG